MQRMTDALSRMLNDPSTRLAMRTLGEREVAATRQNQRSQEQIDEDVELQDNRDREAGDGLESETSFNTTEDDQTVEQEKVARSTSPKRDSPIPETNKGVPDITIDGCSQNVVTDDEEPEVTSHKYQPAHNVNDVNSQHDSETSGIENSNDREECVLPDYSNSIG